MPSDNEQLEEVSRLSKLLSYFSQPLVRQAVAVAAAILLLAGGLYYFLRDEPLPPPKAPVAETQPANDESLVFSSGSIVEQHDGKRVWELNADSIETNLSSKKVRFLQVTGTFYNENEDNGEIGLAAENALLDTVTKDIELNGKVKITGQGAALSAPQARWDGGGRKFSATGGVSVTREDLVLTGENIEASADLEKVVVTGRARLVKGGSANEAR